MARCIGKFRHTLGIVGLRCTRIRHCNPRRVLQQHPGPRPRTNNPRHMRAGVMVEGTLVDNDRLVETHMISSVQARFHERQDQTAPVGPVGRPPLVRVHDGCDASAVHTRCRIGSRRPMRPCRPYPWTGSSIRARQAPTPCLDRHRSRSDWSRARCQCLRQYRRLERGGR